MPFATVEGVKITPLSGPLVSSVNVLCMSAEKLPPEYLSAEYSCHVNIICSLPIADIDNIHITRGDNAPCTQELIAANFCISPLNPPVPDVLPGNYLYLISFDVQLDATIQLIQVTDDLPDECGPKRGTISMPKDGSSS
ncbi:hypothetical protein [Chitinophaga vietnamensis]|uniref:hypothetical protein n=1 Tax=Chitinophaga vietnamensis TaxID=2593957 RepID=UPI001177B4A1|nr:hypothetical protein [Chitinophaga vietnamensis]